MNKEITLPKLLKEEIGKRKKEEIARKGVREFAGPFYSDCQKVLRDNNYVRRRIEVKKGDNDFEISLYQDDNGKICFSYSYYEEGRRRNTSKIQFNTPCDLVFRRTPEENESSPATLEDINDFQELFNFFKEKLLEEKLKEKAMPLDEIDDGF